ncbi:hypothetical protein JG687_00017662 [Phytophthora cactorum]|uniref:Uncharacterized protein n=1 Tax=Phytophthora cactorum TaxID=29920 RepID=A0A8T1TR06_9STRA|nr:hypothetical protein JG687_00017662 [Phytophthora cactorum]
MESSGKKNTFARSVDNFPLVFNSGTRNANLSKAIYWWKKREIFTETPRGTVGISARRETGKKRINAKALQCRGRCRAKGSTGFILAFVFDSGLLRQLALRMMKQPDAPTVVSKGASLIAKITTHWIQSFMETHYVVLRTQTG